MNHGSIPQPALVTVSAENVNELTRRYTEYRQALTTPGDPVRALSLTGDVIDAVRLVAASPTHATATDKGRDGD